MTVGQRIKYLRITKMDMSQVAFADKINVSKQTLYKYENDIITNIPSDKIEAIAALCNVSPAYLMGWENTHTNISPDILQNDENAIDALKLYVQLDKIDRSRIMERMETLLEDEKYSPKAKASLA